MERGEVADDEVSRVSILIKWKKEMDGPSKPICFDPRRGTGKLGCFCSVWNVVAKKEGRRDGRNPRYVGPVLVRATTR